MRLIIFLTAMKESSTYRPMPKVLMPSSDADQVNSSYQDLDFAYCCFFKYARAIHEKFICGFHFLIEATVYSSIE